MRYPEDHPFFQDANLLYAKTVKNSSIGFYDTLVWKNTMKQNIVEKFPCGISGCNIHFNSVEKYIIHYEACHRFSCSICNLSLPNPRFLDIHLREVHDNFFLAQNDRQPMHVCLVDNCFCAFFTHEERGKHMVNVHKYPQDFNDIIIGHRYVKNSAKSNNRKSRKQKKKKKINKSSKNHNSNNMSSSKSKRCKNIRRKATLCL